MGCDIHMYVEGKRTISGESKWVSGDYYSVNPYFTDGEDGEQKYRIQPIYDSRNYRLFAVLAGVRNYSDIEPIAESKGIPSDCCPEIQEANEYWSGDGHSHSYFTLRELQEYSRKNIKTKYSGYVHESEKHKPLSGECPSYWSQWTNMPDHVFMEWEVEENILEPIIEGLRKRASELFYRYNNEQIEEYSNDLRIIFWFDN
ncbi:hypothetical protein [Paenibacillus odorifer]|uniref:hypothetical protein n=1 Tax=Paenibacillus odorifer TaxID=189426 RepID=UPI00096FC3F4|nr:hypothetical protein [Paenibacillus odorifer]OME55138.1 hypothetical protein BSK61_13810 [Paenibacillus odorifer]